MKNDIEIRFLKYIFLKNIRYITTGDLITKLLISKEQELELLKRCSSKGLIVRLKKGLYLAPEKPVIGKWNPEKYYLLYHFANALNLKYQVCGPTLFNKYGYSSQLSDITYIYNTKFSGKRSINNNRFYFIKKNEKIFGGINIFLTPDNLKIYESSAERTLVDAFNEYSRFAAFPYAIEWIMSYLKENTPDILTNMIISYGTVSTKRRCGFIFESAGVSSNFTNLIQKNIGNGKSVIPLIPGKNAKGKLFRKWGIINNE